MRGIVFALLIIVSSATVASSNEFHDLVDAWVSEMRQTLSLSPAQHKEVAAIAEQQKQEARGLWRIWIFRRSQLKEHVARLVNEADNRVEKHLTAQQIDVYEWMKQKRDERYQIVDQMRQVRGDANKASPVSLHRD